jgi:methylmalonyl-CoA mutase cobalamin-binding domain/chain
MSIVSHIVECIGAGKRDEALSLIHDWGHTQGYDRLAEELLIPVLEQFTAQYVNEDESPLARGYIAAKVAEATMRLVAEKTAVAKPSQSKGRIVIGNIEDDFHSLGRKILVTFLQARGWEITDLGNDVPPAQFVDTALEIDAHLIGVSAMMSSTAMNIRHVREEINDRHLEGRLKLAVGGAIFVLRPDLVTMVGGDGTCRTALGASDLFDRLLSTAETSGSGR